GGDDTRANTLALVNGTVITEDSIIDQGTVMVSRGKIKEVLPSGQIFRYSDIKIIDCSGTILIPGFIDIHTHGGRGYDFTDGNFLAFENLSNFYFSHGVTSLLATLSPLKHSDLIIAVSRISEYIRFNYEYTNIIGIHLEGPYLNAEFVGGNNPDYLEPADADSFVKILEESGGLIKLITVAPEIPGINGVINAAVNHGLKVSAGHSSADAETFRNSLSLGVNQVTHLFNGMPQLHHRSPNILSEALLDDRVYVQVIPDGVHIHPSVIKLVFKIKGSDRFVSITDSIKATCLSDGEYNSAGLKVFVHNGEVRTAEGVIAGSTLTMDRAFKFLVHDLGISPVDASKMTSLSASRSIGIDDVYGSIEAGKDADIVCLDANNYEVSLVMKKGSIRFRREKNNN
ncbi:MAG: N-acetylglucosamine-6-phosphate deacetylase, partial [Candidatus Kryptoniota bacterium]